MDLFDVRSMVPGGFGGIVTHPTFYELSFCNPSDDQYKTHSFFPCWISERGVVTGSSSARRRLPGTSIPHRWVSCPGGGWRPLLSASPPSFPRPPVPGIKGAISHQFMDYLCFHRIVNIFFLSLQPGISHWVKGREVFARNGFSHFFYIFFSPLGAPPPARVLRPAHVEVKG